MIPAHTVRELISNRNNKSMDHRYSTDSTTGLISTQPQLQLMDYNYSPWTTITTTELQLQLMDHIYNQWITIRTDGPQLQPIDHN